VFLGPHVPAFADSGGFIPMDPPGVDMFELEPDDEAEPDSIVRFQREQLALQSEGLLTPAFGESIPDFVRRRAKELNQATSERPFDEVGSSGFFGDLAFPVKGVLCLWATVGLDGSGSLSTFGDRQQRANGIKAEATRCGGAGQANLNFRTGPCTLSALTEAGQGVVTCV
jgi:hypothetical protein